MFSMNKMPLLQNKKVIMIVKLKCSVCVCLRRTHCVRAGPGRQAYLQGMPIRCSWHHGGLHLLDCRHIRRRHGDAGENTCINSLLKFTRCGGKKLQNWTVCSYRWSAIRRVWMWWSGPIHSSSSSDCPPSQSCLSWERWYAGRITCCDCGGSTPTSCRSSTASSQVWTSSTPAVLRFFNYYFLIALALQNTRDWEGK